MCWLRVVLSTAAWTHFHAQRTVLRPGCQLISVYRWTWVEFVLSTMSILHTVSYVKHLLPRRYDVRVRLANCLFVYMFVCLFVGSNSVSALSFRSVSSKLTDADA